MFCLQWGAWPLHLLSHPHVCAFEITTFQAVKVELIIWGCAWRWKLIVANQAELETCLEELGGRCLLAYNVCHSKGFDV